MNKPKTIPRPLSKRARKIISNAMFRRAKTLGLDQNAQVRMAIAAQEHYINGATALDACVEAEFQHIGNMASAFYQMAA